MRDAEAALDVFLATDDLRNDEIMLRTVRTVEGDLARRWVPTYHFAIVRVLDGEEVGTCDFRVGNTEKLFFGGNIGYAVYEPYRGHHYAGKACLLLFELARRHAMRHLYITCNPENTASSRTCQWLGGALVATIELPDDNDMRVLEGETHKCIFRFDLDG